MEYRYIGNSGLRVSPICIGTMTIGSWTDKAGAFRSLGTCYDRGLNFLDAAEIYPVHPDATPVAAPRKSSVSGCGQTP